MDEADRDIIIRSKVLSGESTSTIYAVSIDWHGSSYPFTVEYDYVYNKFFARYGMGVLTLDSYDHFFDLSREVTKQYCVEHLVDVAFMYTIESHGGDYTFMVEPSANHLDMIATYIDDKSTRLVTKSFICDDLQCQLHHGLEVVELSGVYAHTVVRLPTLGTLALAVGWNGECEKISAEPVDGNTYALDEDDYLKLMRDLKQQQKSDEVHVTNIYCAAHHASVQATVGARGFMKKIDPIPKKGTYTERYYGYTKPET